MPRQPAQQDMSGRSVPGLPARRFAAAIFDNIVHKRRPIEEAFAVAAKELSGLEERDRALVRMLVATTLRRLGTLRRVLSSALERGLPDNARQAETALLIGAAQILFLDVPDHAAVDLSVRLVQEHRHTARFAGLVNAVLRKIAREGRVVLASLDTALLDTPAWLIERWTRHYGDETARAIACANRHEAAIDLSVKSDPQEWAKRLGGHLMPNGSVRLAAPGSIPSLPGFNEGQWWVQDAAATLPVKVLGDVRGKTIVDLCAAPGGKSMQLAAAGANVVAVDRSAQRLDRLRENFARLNLSCEIVVADAAEWSGGPFDTILLDAPCTATGTIRRHPDIPWLKSARDLEKLTALQTRLLDNSVSMLKAGGLLVYCTCSLEPEECELAIEALLKRNPQIRRNPIDIAEMPGLSEFVTPAGDLRTLPCHWPNSDSQLAGLDGFFTARLTRS